MLLLGFRSRSGGITYVRVMCTHAHVTLPELTDAMEDAATAVFLMEGYKALALHIQIIMYALNY